MLFLLVLVLSLFSHQCSGSWTISHNRFQLNHVNITVKAGCVHYFRVPPSHWHNRLARLKSLGLNAIESVVPWNFHESAPGVVDLTSASHDLVAFLRMAHRLGLLVFLRPGPYICAEWEAGGLPAFLLTEAGLQIRTYNAPYIKHVTRWLTTLYTLLRSSKLLHRDGGPIVAVQIENEYGFYGDVANNPLDAKYMRYLRNLAAQQLGTTDIMFYTTDNAGALAAGTLNGSDVTTLVDFGPGTDPAAAFAAAVPFNPPGQSPPMCTEFYSGWLEHWNEPLSGFNTSSAWLAQWLATTLAINGSFSLYMAAGGTNFEFWNGANCDAGEQSLWPVVTSYDYDAPIDEQGADGYGSDGINKFTALRKVIVGSGPTPAPVPAPPAAALNGGGVPVVQYASLAANLPALCAGRTVVAPGALPFEQFNHSRGFAAYQVQLPASTHATLDFGGLIRDQISVLVDGRLVATVTRNAPRTVELLGHAGAVNLTLVVESLGRINFGGAILDSKGLQTTPLLNGIAIAGPWSMCPLLLDSAQQAALAWSPVPADGAVVAAPAFFQFASPSSGAAPVDTFLDLQDAGFVHTSTWVNGNNVGRMRSVGAQRALFVPRDFLATSGNDTVVVLEMQATITVDDFVTVTTRDSPEWTDILGAQ
jgi:hypothetical protein